MIKITGPAFNKMCHITHQIIMCIKTNLFSHLCSAAVLWKSSARFTLVLILKTISSECSHEGFHSIMSVSCSGKCFGVSIKNTHWWCFSWCYSFMAFFLSSTPLPQRIHPPLHLPKLKPIHNTKALGDGRRALTIPLPQMRSTTQTRALLKTNAPNLS